MASTIQIRVDDDLKNKSDQLFKDLGTDLFFKSSSTLI
jgi:DNA-damage-inducible protein J